MEAKIEVQKIEINPTFKPREAFQKKTLGEILRDNIQKVYHCSTDFQTEFLSDDSLFAHPVLAGYYKAYVNHCPITVNADILWMLILQGFSHHMEVNHEKLRHKFVDFEGKKNIVVDGNEDNLDLITKEAWEDTFKQFVEQVKQYVGGMVINLFTPCFTTTTPTIQTSSQIAVMSILKHYFKFIRLCGGCGFSYIQLEGTLQDYMLLKMKIEGLIGYDIDDWINELIPVVDKIIETKKGNVDVEFWRNIIKNDYVDGYEGSGTKVKVERIQGWLLKFFPMIWRRNPESGKKEILRRENLNAPFEVRDFKHLPNEMVDADVLIINKQTLEKTTVICKTGFIGATQNENNVVKPEIGWIMCFEKPKYY